MIRNFNSLKNTQRSGVSVDSYERVKSSLAVEEPAKGAEEENNSCNIAHVTKRHVIYDCGAGELTYIPSRDGIYKNDTITNTEKYKTRNGYVEEALETNLAAGFIQKCD